VIKLAFIKKERSNMHLLTKGKHGLKMQSLYNNNSFQIAL
jgi:hypothetical protein